MRKVSSSIIVLLSITSTVCSIAQTAVEKKGNAQYVNSFFGIDDGNVMPGVSVPFGMVKLSPDVVWPYPTSGYNRSSPIEGFSHTHTSGTGGAARYGNILIKPQIGSLVRLLNKGLARQNENASSGYYNVKLIDKKGLIDVKLTATDKIGFHEYRFNPAHDSISNATIQIDVSHTLFRNIELGARCTGAEARLIGTNAFEGRASFEGGWGALSPYTIYFYAQFDQSFADAGTWQNDTLISSAKNVEGNKIGLYSTFKLNDQKTIKLKVAISYKSIDKAKENLSLLPIWNFEAVKNSNIKIWNNYLGAIDVEGGSSDQRAIFYSALKNTLIMPTDVSGQTSSDRKAPQFWDHYCIWDQFRSVMPLYTVLYPDKQVKILNSLLNTYSTNGWLPDAWTAGHYNFVQGGSNADVVFADAFAKGLKGFDKPLALKALLKNAYEQSDDPRIKGRFLTDYLKLGYVTSKTFKGSSSRTMEYAYNDYCIAQVALKMGKKEIYNALNKRSQNVFKLFNDSVGYFWAKDSIGKWQPDFSLHSRLKEHWHDPYFFEGGSEVYSYYVPHDMQGLIQRHGGADKFSKRLDAFFDDGRFYLGNEPLFLVPYSYNYAGKQANTALRVRRILQTSFKNSDKGIPGQDDGGAISSWYVFSSIGVFPVAGQNVYLIGSPLFNQISIHLPNGKDFKIIAKGNSPTSIYIQSALLNKKPLSKSWLSHEQISKGGELELIMGSKPSLWGSSNLPPSITSVIK
ncbi:MAG: glycoside hydrolase family 92 protein [Pyrinomonadaceae bacterium]|nr:glycoside hydrolase family 92 protein [Sphingobacteriaceae bacterium]